jgi:NADH-quinone oxidoreductase subunit N
VEFYEFINRLIVDTKGDPAGLRITADSSLFAFLPELTICGTILLMLTARLFQVGERLDRAMQRYLAGSLTFYIALVGSVLALAFAAPWRHLGVITDTVSADPASAVRMEIFTGMLVYDTFTVYMRSLLLLFVFLFLLFSRLTGLPDREDAADIYSLVLGATLGMCLMASSNHLLMVFLSVEMASVPSYALAGMLKGRRVSSEAALKYSVFGAGTAGVMLYGISLIAGITHTVHLPSVATELARMDIPQMIASGHGTGELMVLSVGGLMLAVGLAFKLSAVPFHFWCPDVFEGASAEVGAFLSVASKAAALALLIRVAVGLGTVPEDFQNPLRPGDRTANQQAGDSPETLALFNVADETRATLASPSDGEGSLALDRPIVMQRLAPVRDFAAKLIALLAVITCTFGNLAAYGQTNIKRLLAYSTIAHAGYMMMAVSPLIVAAQVAPETSKAAAAGLAIYLFVYLFMNLGAFAVVAFLRNAMRSEEIQDYAGLVRRHPVIVICFSLMLFSLVGMPPLAGFIGKFAIFASLADAYRLTHHDYLLLVLLVGAVNTFLSLFYYVKVVKCMTMDPEPDHRAPFTVPTMASAYIVLITVPTVILVVGWNGVWNTALAAARYLLG